jgi:hypothetical protein
VIFWVKRLILFVGICVLVSGCSSTGSYVSTEKGDGSFLGSTVKKNLKYEGIKRNPVIVIHGFQGAKLADSKTNKNLWGNFDASTIYHISDEKMKGLSHPLKKNESLRNLKDNVVPQNILKDVTITILGIPLKFPAYETLIQVLKNAGYEPEGRPLSKGKNYYTLFKFAYDWRRDIPSNTENLEKFIKLKRKYLQDKYKELYGIENFNVQFDIIAHSMGGLVSRYYLQYGTQDLPNDGSLPELNWGGNKYIDRLILCGTPNAGYLDTFLELLRGGKLQPFKPALLGTLPTYYQMLPAPSTNSIVYSDDPDGSPVDVFDPELWVKMKWGIVNPEEDDILHKLLPTVKTKEERLEIAKDHLTKCLLRAKQFIAAMKVEAIPPDDIELYLVLGHGFKTTRRAYINRETGKIEKIDYSGGDGKVSASSALWDLRATREWSFFMKSPIKWHNILVVRAAHMGILDAGVFEDNILVLLPMLESPKQEEILTEKFRKKILK